MNQNKSWIQLNNCIAPNAPICYGILKPGPEFPGGVPVIKVRNFSKGRIKPEEVIHTSPTIDAQYQRSRILEGDILLSIRGSTGDVTIVPTELDGANITQDSARIRVGDIQDRDYLYFALKAPDVQRLIQLNTIGQAVKGINIAEVRKLSVYWPSPKERIVIAAQLKRWGIAINLTEKLLAKKQLRRKGLMQQLLSGKRRLPGFDGAWRKVRLGEVFDNRRESNRHDLPLVAITTSKGVIPRDDMERKDSSNKDKSKYLRICPGDIGYNTMRMWQGVSGFSQLEGIISPAYTVVTPRSGIDGKFMALLFKFPSVVHKFYRHSQGLVSDTWNLKFRHFSEIEVMIPEEKEQQTIAEFFGVVDREIDLLKVKLIALHEQKKGLMQQLLTGKVRVKV